MALQWKATKPRRNLWGRQSSGLCMSGPVWWGFLYVGRKQMLNMALLLAMFSGRRLAGLLLTTFLPWVSQAGQAAGTHCTHAGVLGSWGASGEGLQLKENPQRWYWGPSWRTVLTESFASVRLFWISHQHLQQSQQALLTVAISGCPQAISTVTRFVHCWWYLYLFRKALLWLSSSSHRSMMWKSLQYPGVKKRGRLRGIWCLVLCYLVWEGGKGCWDLARGLHWAGCSSAEGLLEGGHSGCWSPRRALVCESKGEHVDIQRSAMQWHV